MTAPWGWLEPLGMSDGYGESMLSMYRRAADTFSRSLREVIRECCGMSGIKLRHLEMNGEALNGAYLFQTQLLLGALGGATGRLDLSGTTLLPAFRGMEVGLRVSRAWCPVCLDDSPPYAPLVWSLWDYRACVRHGVRMESRCGRCRRDESRVLRRSNPRTCAWCLTPFAKSKPADAVVSATTLAALSAMRRYQAGNYHAFEDGLPRIAPEPATCLLEQRHASPDR